LDDTIPPRHLDRNLLVATWNLRAFGRVTEKWRSEPDDSPRRDLFDLRCIAEIVSRFDVVAIEEAREDLSALRLVLEALGDTWGLIATDVTRGRAGNSERLVFVFDTRRLKPSGLAGELVVAIEEETDVTATGLDRQFARTPYAVSFEAGTEELTLVTLHVIWGDDEQKRAAELREIATWLADWPNRESTWSKNLITLGDFNVNRGPLYDALISTGLTTPAELNASRARSSTSRASSTSTTRSPGFRRTATARCSRSSSSAQVASISCRCFKAGSRRHSSRGRSPTTIRSGSSSVCDEFPARVVFSEAFTSPDIRVGRPDTCCVWLG
jgi:endonuclease/exonuclease/phosphatase family metal-dependent hydrolase